PSAHENAPVPRQPGVGGIRRLNPEERLASILAALESAGLVCLVLGGHAVRHYGLQRYTNDFDLTLAPEGWSDLPDRLAGGGPCPGAPRGGGEGGRRGASRRFRIGTPAEGEEEWRDFWLETPLLAPFPVLFPRREMATYGGRELPFLGLRDLLRS